MFAGEGHQVAKDFGQNWKEWNFQSEVALKRTHDHSQVTNGTGVKRGREGRDHHPGTSPKEQDTELIVLVVTVKDHPGDSNFSGFDALATHFHLSSDGCGGYES